MIFNGFVILITVVYINNYDEQIIMNVNDLITFVF